MKLLAVLLSAFCLPASALAADRVVAALSENRVSITAGFVGLEILVYGAIARADPADAEPLGVVVTILGPARPVVVRRKSQVAGLWINTDSIRVAQAPSFYAVASSGPLAQTISRTDDLRYRVSLEHALRHVEASATGQPRETFLEAVVRLRQRAGLYVISPGSITIDQGVLFRATIPLPSNIVEGNYSAQVLLTRDRAVIDSFRTQIDVRKAGIERIIFDLAQHAPMIYGFASILVAITAGFLASAVFQYMRR
jgi:uncharacterized protein (TIGR02186 family)